MELRDDAERVVGHGRPHVGIGEGRFPAGRHAGKPPSIQPVQGIDHENGLQVVLPRQLNHGGELTDVLRLTSCPGNEVLPGNITLEQHQVTVLANRLERGKHALRGDQRG